MCEKDHFGSKKRPYHTLFGFQQNLDDLQRNTTSEKISIYCGQIKGAKVHNRKLNEQSSSD